MSKSVNVQLKWEGGERFRGTSDGVPVLLDGSNDDALSPMQALAAGLAGCMAIDVVMILQKGRQPLDALNIELKSTRADQPPRRFVSFDLHFKIQGDVEATRVERAIKLSREKYCSVWQTLRQDVDFEVHFDLTPEASS